MADASIDRLTRIEDKLDKMSEAIVSLARMEERMITLFKRMDTYDAQQSLVSDRLAKVEVAQANTDGSSKWVNIVIIAVITGALSLALFSK